MMQGKGTEIIQNGHKYVGDFWGDKYDGKGVLTWPNGEIGEKYEGEFWNGHMHGKGVYYFSTGKKFVGEFNYGQHIEGHYHHEDGTIVAY